MKKKVAFLSRVSTLEQHQSIDNQKQIFKEWIEKHKESCTLYKIYEDEGISGAKGYKRLEWLKMIEDGKQRKFDIIVSKSFSRFGRNQEETLRAIKDLRAKEIRIIFLEDGLDSEQDATKFGLFAWLAEQEAQKTSERIKLVWNNYNEIGKIHACRAPYGYIYDKEIKNFVIEEHEAIVVENIFKLFLNGYGYKKIADKLTLEGVSTKRGGKWEGNTISNILKNEVYIGTLIQGKTSTIDVTRNESRKLNQDCWKKHVNHHEAIIDIDVFNKVQEEIKVRSENINGKQKVRYSKKHLFSNILFCGECGSAMSAKIKNNLNNKKKYFCNKYEKYGTRCGHKSNAIYEEVIINYILKKLDEIVDKDYEALSKIFELNPSNIKKLQKRKDKLNKELEGKAQIANKLLERLMNGKLTEEHYSLQNSSIIKEMTNLKRMSEEVEKQIESLSSNKEKLRPLKSGIQDLIRSDVSNWTNAMIKEVIDRIEIYSDDTIEIRYKYLFYK